MTDLPSDRPSGRPSDRPADRPADQQTGSAPPSPAPRSVPSRAPQRALEEARRDAPPGLYFSRLGHWFHDGDRIFHDGLHGLLVRHVARAADGGLVVTTGRDVLPFVAEDCPVLVREATFTAHGLHLTLQDGREEDAAGPVVVGADDRWRIPVRGDTLWALLPRAVCQGLWPHLEANDDGVSTLEVDGVVLPVVTGDADWSAAPTSATDWDAWSRRRRQDVAPAKM